MKVVPSTNKLPYVRSGGASVTPTLKIRIQQIEMWETECRFLKKMVEKLVIPVGGDAGLYAQLRLSQTELQNWQKVILPAWRRKFLLDAAWPEATETEPHAASYGAITVQYEEFKSRMLQMISDWMDADPLQWYGPVTII